MFRVPDEGPVENITDSRLLILLNFAEKRYTKKGLDNNTGYQILLKEAFSRGLRKEVLTPEQMKIRLEAEGPAFWS